ncbi:hypothetical protein CN380_14575 [Bacillus sp. AFS017274]|nr:hypothetical protein CN380_14575 [Bacillus sp. AFS017274]
MIGEARKIPHIIFYFDKQKEVRSGLTPNHDFILENLVIIHEFLPNCNELPVLKKFVTLLPINWLAKPPQTLALMRLGRQSAEREGISEINWNVL